MNHMTRHAKTIDGVTFVNAHSGQKQAYGDSFYEYEIESDLPAAKVEKIASTKIRAAISKSQYRQEYRDAPTMENHFRHHYTFKKTGEGKYFYSVCSPYTD